VFLRDGRLRLVFVEIQGGTPTKRDPNSEQYISPVVGNVYRRGNASDRYADLPNTFDVAPNIRSSGHVSLYRYFYRDLKHSRDDPPSPAHIRDLGVVGNCRY